ncbi:SDR family oxidoreductase [Rhabdothermincola salaria]|uniref:SDR family oxidoreductase n=1 Tax=Rhabdothermincola salaria TaxID=2903142 RepID=UPI001E5B156F|nr:SDR family oxidoreductase [Rhabdothermincola salaria]MCD9624109.1 SDR family oxidoreductase [Rhabdothermincola salaria]
MAQSLSLDGVRVLVVGASSGIGRAYASCAHALGAEVCVSSRRADALQDLCDELGAGHVVAADVTEPGKAEEVVARAVALMGGLDVVLYSAGFATLRPLRETQVDDWTAAYQVNVVGPSMVAQAAVEVLSPEGIVSFISSESAGEVRWGLAPYASSKAALDTAIRYWRHEHPERRFQRVIMGATMPTGFGDLMGASEHLATALERWAAVGISGTVMHVDDVGRQLAEITALMLAHPEIDVPDIYLDPRGEALR